MKKKFIRIARCTNIDLRTGKRNCRRVGRNALYGDVLCDRHYRSTVKWMNDLKNKIEHFYGLHDHTLWGG